MVSIADAVPAPTATTTYRALIQDRFYYALNSDETTWDAWVAKVNEPETYNSTDAHKTAKDKFSYFLLYWHCLAEAAADGCCLVESSHGALCSIIPTGGDGLSIGTHRMSKAKWDTAVAAFSANQGEITAAIEADSDMQAIPVSATALLYFDVMSCSLYQDATDHKFTCTVWQVNWKDGDETDGYARFGTDESIQAAFIDASAAEALTMTNVSLLGALQTVAATMTGLAAAFLLSF